MHAQDVALLALAGFMGGAVNAIAGGGSLLVFPALVTTGLSTLAANVTNSVALWPGYLGNLAGLGRLAAGSARRHADLVAACTIGAALGVTILLHTSTSAFDVVVPFLVVAATLLVAIQPALTQRIAGRAQHPVILRIVVTFASIYGGYFGGALGVILLGTIGLTTSIELRELNILKTVLTMVVSTVSMICFIAFSSIDWTAVAVVAPAALAGGATGGRVAMRIDERPLRLIIVLFGMTIGIWLGLRAWQS